MPDVEKIMIYLFHGKDTFRLKRKVDKMIDDWIEKYGNGGIVKLDGKTIDFFDLKSEVFSCSIFSSKKFIIIQNGSNNIKLKEGILENAELFANSENLILFIEEELKSGKSDAFAAFIKKRGAVEEFSYLEGKEFEDWVVSETGKNGVSIKNGAIKELVRDSRGDLWKIENEIKKLANYVLAEGRKEITLADIDKLVDKFEDGNIFAITDAVGSRNKKLVLFLIDNYFKNGGVALILFATIATHIKNLMIVKESPSFSPAELGMNPFVKMKCSSQANNFALEELKKIFNIILDLDKKIKVGQIGQEEALDVFVLSL